MSFTGCGAVCRGSFPLQYDELIAVWKFLKDNGLSEDLARELASDAGQLAGALIEHGYGPLAGIAAALVTSQCADCAVDSAYAENSPPPPAPGGGGSPGGSGGSGGGSDVSHIGPGHGGPHD